MKNSNPVWYKRQFDSASGYNGNNARNLKPNYYMSLFIYSASITFDESQLEVVEKFCVDKNIELDAVEKPYEESANYNANLFTVYEPGITVERLAELKNLLD